MSKIKNGGLDQYGAERFEQQQSGTAGVEGVNYKLLDDVPLCVVAMV